MQTDTPLLEVKNLKVELGGNPILNGISFKLDKGEPFAITGESGSGKTTLLFAIAGLVKPIEGEVWIKGAKLTTLSNRERAHRLGIVFQDYQLFPHLTVLENVLLSPSLHGGPGGGLKERAESLLANLKLEKLASRYPHELSGGQKQRVAIARALILQPTLLLLDEPSAALDIQTTNELAELLTKLNSEIQIVVVSHDLPFLQGCCPRRTEMRHGRLGEGH